MFRLRPVTVGRIRKLAFDNNISMQELASQMIEHCLAEMDGEKSEDKCSE